MGSIAIRYDASPLAALPAPLPPAISALPQTSDWANVKSLGVKGDGTTDDSVAIQRAIASHRVLYFQSGHYIVTDTLTLKPDTVIIGLHPTLTQLDLPGDTPAFRGVGAAKPLLLAPSGGTDILSGIGVLTNGTNPRAVGTLWMAGEQSLIDDVRYLGGHGSGTNPYNNDHTADPDLKKRWDGQYPSLWITNGGGGTFARIWTPDTFAQAGLYVSCSRHRGGLLFTGGVIPDVRKYPKRRCSQRHTADISSELLLLDLTPELGGIGTAFRDTLLKIGTECIDSA